MLEGIDVIERLVHQAETYGADPSLGHIIGGISSGGHIATMAIHEMVRRGNLKIIGGYITISDLVAEDNIPHEYKDIWISRDILEGKAYETFCIFTNVDKTPETRTKALPGLEWLLASDTARSRPHF